MSFAETGLPADKLVEKAYGLVQDDDAAVLSAQALVAEAKNLSVETLAGHLLAFANRSEWTAEKITAEFSARVSDIVEGVRAVYDKLGGKPAASPDDAVKQSFLAVGIIDLEYAMEKYGKSAVDGIIIDTSTQDAPGKFKIVQDSVRGVLERAFNAYAAMTRPLVGTTSEPALEAHLKRAWLKTKLEEKPGVKPAAFGFGVR